MQSFAIWVTTNCNMNCTYCYEGENKKDSNISNETLEQTLSFIKRYMLSFKDEKIIVDFHGGEPLLQFDKIQYAVKDLLGKFEENISFGITTNGTIVSEEIFKFLTENFHYSLSISLDGNRKTHNMNRKLKNGAGSYEIVIKNAKKFLAIRDDVRIRMTINSKTVDSLYSSIDSLIDSGFKIIAPAIDYFDNEWDKEKMEILQEQIILLKEKLRNKQAQINMGLINNYSKKAIGICTGGTNSYHISPDGYIYPCAFVVGKQEHVIGDVFTGLDDNRIRTFRKINETIINICKGCSHELACISVRCRLLNKIITGDYYTPASSVCSVENIKHRIYCIKK